MPTGGISSGDYCPLKHVVYGAKYYLFVTAKTTPQANLMGAIADITSGHAHWCLGGTFSEGL
jgi:hypothetical protein